MELLITYLSKNTGMLSGRGIDGELRSKFGELTEKFWKSGSWGSPSEANNFQAIYLASEGGKDGSGGKTLSALKRDSGKSLISTGSGRGDQVESAFGFCVGSKSGNRCNKEGENASIVLVGDDPNINSSMAWDNLKSQSWNQTSLVRSGHSYEGLFDSGIWKGVKKGKESKLNRQKVQNILSHQGGEKWMRDILCPWVWDASQGSLQTLKHRCGGFGLGSSSLRDVSLIEFFKRDLANKYFKENAWNWKGKGWEYLALLTLINLWSDTLGEVKFDRAAGIFNSELDKFKLSPLMSSNSKVVYLDADNSGNDLKTISYHSGGMWAVRLCPNNENCSNNKGLNLTVGDGKFCVIDVICLDRSLSKGEFATLKSKMNGIYNGGSGTWSMVFGSSNGKDHLERLLIALLVACFKDIEKVTLTVQKPSKEGKVIFKLMEEKR